MHEKVTSMPMSADGDGYGDGDGDSREADLHAHVSCDRFNNLDFKPGSIAGAVQLVVSWAGCLLNGIFLD